MELAELYDPAISNTPTVRRQKAFRSWVLDVNVGVNTLYNVASNSLHLATGRGEDDAILGGVRQYKSEELDGLPIIKSRRRPTGSATPSSVMTQRLSRPATLHATPRESKL